MPHSTRRFVLAAVGVGALLGASGGAAGQPGEGLAQNPVVVGHPVDHVAYGFEAAWGLGDRRLVKVDPERLAVRRRSARFPAPGADLAAGPDALWVRTTSALWRVDPGSLSRTKVADVTRSGPIAVSGTRVWYSADGRGAIRRLDDAGRVPQGAIVRLPGNVGALALGEGFLWAAASSGSAIWKLDPTDGRLLATFDAPASEGSGRPAQLAFTPGVAWAMVEVEAPVRAELVGLDVATGAEIEREPEPFDPTPDGVEEGQSIARGLVAADGGLWYAREELQSSDGGFSRPSGVARYDLASGRFGSAATDRATSTLLDLASETPQPRDLATDGSRLWIADGIGVTRVAQEGPRPAITPVRGIVDVAVARNRVWVLTNAGLRRVSARTGRPVGRAVRLRGIRRVPDGQMLESARGWLWSLAPGGRRLHRIDPRNGRTVGVTRLRADDSVAFPSWGTVGLSGGRLLARRPGRARALFSRRAPLSSVAELGAYRGELWGADVAEGPGDDGYGEAIRFDRRGGIAGRTRFRAPGVFDLTPTDVEVDRRDVWIATQDAGLWRVRRRGQQARPVPVGAVPVSVASGGPDVWVVALDSGSLHRVSRRSGRSRGPSYDLPPTSFRTRVVVGAGSAWVAPFFGRDVLARVPLRG